MVSALFDCYNANKSLAKAKFILATDGVDFEAENIVSGETVACEYNNFPDHFGFFLALAGIARHFLRAAADIGGHDGQWPHEAGARAHDL